MCKNMVRKMIYDFQHIDIFTNDVKHNYIQIELPKDEIKKLVEEYNEDESFTPHIFDDFLKLPQSF